MRKLISENIQKNKKEISFSTISYLKLNVFFCIKDNDLFNDCIEKIEKELEERNIFFTLKQSFLFPNNIKINLFTKKDYKKIQNQ